MLLLFLLLCQGLGHAGQAQVMQACEGELLVVMVISFSGSDAGHGCSRGPGAARWSYRVSRAVGPDYSPGCV